MLFVDYSSAFNTIVPATLVAKLQTLGLNRSLCSWILDFLTGRSQVVRMGNNTSSPLILNTGAPQGCVLSPLLYSLYTHDCTHHRQDYFNSRLLKGIVYPKMKIRSSFTHPQVVPNLYEFLCSAEHKGRYFEESLSSGCFGEPLTSIVGKQILWNQWCSRTTLFPIFPHSYRFGNTWGWVNDDRIFIFG